MKRQYAEMQLIADGESDTKNLEKKKLEKKE